MGVGRVWPGTTQCPPLLYACTGLDFFFFVLRKPHPTTSLTSKLDINRPMESGLQEPRSKHGAYPMDHIAHILVNKQEWLTNFAYKYQTATIKLLIDIKLYLYTVLRGIGLEEKEGRIKVFNSLFKGGIFFEKMDGIMAIQRWPHRLKFRRA